MQIAHGTINSFNKIQLPAFCKKTGIILACVSNTSILVEAV